MQITKRIVALTLFSGGMYMLLLAMTRPRHPTVLGYIALWVGAVIAIVLATILSKSAKTNRA